MSTKEVSPSPTLSVAPENLENFPVHAEASSFEDSEKQVGGTNHDQNSVVQIDVVAEAKLLRKLDLNLIPILFALCKLHITCEEDFDSSLQYPDMMSYMDRSNVG